MQKFSLEFVVEIQLPPMKKYLYIEEFMRINQGRRKRKKKERKRKILSNSYV